jgi:hypothetical protein
MPGVDVALSAAGSGGLGRFDLFGGQGTLTDEAGRFRFDHLAAGRYSLTAALRDRSSPALDVVLLAAEAKEGLVLSLSAGATLRGAVTGLPEALKAGVNVTARGPADYFASARTGADGTFELVGVPAGPIDLRGTAGDMLTSSRSAATQVIVAPGEAEAFAELAFPAGFTLSGQVTRGGGPLPEAFVTAFAAGGGGIAASARSDASGSYRLEGLQEGSYSVGASLPEGGASTRETVRIESDATHEIVFPSARLAGSVVEAGSRAPLPDAIVEVAAPAGGGPGGFLRMAATDNDGRFALEDLEPRSYAVTVRRAGYQFEKKNLTAAEQGTDDVLLELVRGEGIGLRARDGIFGVPLRGLMARAIDAQGTAVFTGSVSLDGEGRGEIPSLRPGRYTLLLDPSEYAALGLDVSVPSPMLEVAFTPGGTLELHAPPERLAQGPIRCRILKANGAPHLLNIFSSSGDFTVSTPVRRLENLASGSYTLVVEEGAGRAFTVAEAGTTVIEMP